MLSLGIIAVVIAYGINKFTIMIDQGDTNYQTIKTHNKLKTDIVFENNVTKFNIAFGLSDLFTGTYLSPDYVR